LVWDAHAKCGRAFDVSLVAYSKKVRAQTPFKAELWPPTFTVEGEEMFAKLAPFLKGTELIFKGLCSRTEFKGLCSPHKSVQPHRIVQPHSAIECHAFAPLEALPCM
jgi:hypothetical protein